MKKIFSFLPVLVISISLFYSCNSGGSGEAYTIKMRLNKGDSFTQDMQMNMQMNSSVVNMNMKMNMGCLFQVTNSDSADKELKLTYKKMHTSMDMSTLNHTKNMSDSLINKTNNDIIGKTITMQLSKDNEIVNVSGFDELMNGPGIDSAGRQMMKKMFSKDQLNNMFGIMFSMYPKSPVRVGDSWNGETKMNISNLDMNVKIKYTLLSVKDNLAEIGLDGTLGVNGEIATPASGVKMDMSGTQKGTITVRMDNGYIHSGSYKMDVKVDVQAMGQKLPMTMKADYMVKGI